MTRQAHAMRTADDVTAIVTTVVETRDDVRRLRQGVQALLDHAGLELPPDARDDE